MTLSTIHFSQVSGKTALKLAIRPESPSPCPYASMDAGFFGWPLSDDQVPTRLVAAPGFDPDALGDVRRMEWHFIFSARAADVLRNFDLGSSRLTPVPLVDADGRDIPTGDLGPLHHLHVSERKDTLVPLEEDMFQGINRPRGLVSGWPDTKPGAIPVEEEAETGVELWRDPMWDFGLFASARLVEALRAADIGVAEFQWMPARRATDEDRANIVLARQNHATMPPNQG
ncbi:hypothetical protein PARPLA_00293 [Rhodobacteraceae bacterium THAF1]|uniref:hypothetical protein n=1 Tax=Palleronia sp. THAF1 TaxID=2587842 RepID=UPI000F3CE9C3|nr:hypothetical protein [Palleronia sp. THAF1]QFU10142.1 hypothetical protein FIU81_15795 [Palleronia sp. THAF1]VDC16953.1 hypothetical protein PARPLA_00293 [Rhodobacteraceae bacterium THAF1]